MSPQVANKIACQEYSAALYQKATLIPPPEGELLALMVTGARLILEEVVSPSENKHWNSWRKLGILSPTVIGELYFATVWTFMALFLSRQKESEEDWIVACTSLVGEIEMNDEPQEGIWRGLPVGNFPSIAKALHFRYRELLGPPERVYGGLSFFQLHVFTTYVKIGRDYYKV